MTDDEEYEILQMFARDSAIHVEGCVAKTKSLAICDDVLAKRLEGVDSLEDEVCLPKSLDMKEGMVEHMASMPACKVGPEIEVKTFDCAIVCSLGREYGERPKYVQSFWARATTETLVKLGGYDDPVLALVDHGSEINIMSRHVYEKGKWPIDTHHGWVMRATNSEQTQLYGACPAVSTKIGDVEVEQNFFVSNHGAYLVILGNHTSLHQGWRPRC